MKLKHAEIIESTSRNVQLTTAFAQKYGGQLGDVHDLIFPGTAGYWLIGDAGRKRALEVFGRDEWKLTGNKATKVVDGVTVEVDAITTAQTVTLAA